jgi:crotonobetaine/carnitine-CoA ligase
MPTLLQVRAAEDPQKPLLRAEGITKTRAQVVEEAQTMARRLLDAGITAGDRVGVFSPNRLETIELWLGLSWIGAILVPINASLRGEALEHVMRDCEPRLLVVDPELLRPLETLLPGSLEQIWLFDDYAEQAYPSLGSVTVTSMPVSGESEPQEPVVRGSDTSAIIYTSGTTGPAKGVCCPQAQFYWWGVNTAEVLDLRADDTLYTSLPLSHTNALNTVAQALIGDCVYFLGPRFSASRFWQRLTEADASVTYILGAMVSILSRERPRAHDNAHRVRTALSPATSPDLVEVFRQRFGVEVVDGHGMTESNLTIGPRDGLSRPGLMGRVMAGFSARVVDEDDAPVPDGTAGELVLRADEPFAFATGYWAQPEATLKSRRNLWLHTGDRVIREPDGFFRFIDRLTDSMRRRGENIAAWEVEQAFLRYPDVAAVAAYAVPSSLGEDEVMVSVVPRDGATLDPVALIAHCEPLLAYFAIPRYIRMTDDLPMTSNGKVQKFVLREIGVDQTTWDREGSGYELSR